MTLMSTIIDRMLIQSGIKTIITTQDNRNQIETGKELVTDVEQAFQQWKVTMPAFALKGNGFGDYNVNDATEENFEHLLVTIWRDEISRIGRLNIESVWKIRHLFRYVKVASSVLVQRLAKVLRRTRIICDSIFVYLTIFYFMFKSWWPQLVCFYLGG